MFIPAPLMTALEDSVPSGKFIDTKFWVFDRLNRETGRLEQPTAVFANSAVVRSVPHLSARRFLIRCLRSDMFDRIGFSPQ